MTRKSAALVASDMISISGVYIIIVSIYKESTNVPCIISPRF